MKPLLSVIIATKNEPYHELNETIRSIRESVNHEKRLEIVVVDDCSSTPVVLEDKSCILIHNTKWLGVGPSRHIGVASATADKVLICDGHMRFEKGWLMPVVYALDAQPSLVLCGACFDARKPGNYYHGGRFVVLDESQPPRYRILTVKWNRRTDPEDDMYHITGLMGALYAMNRYWFMHIGGLRMLRGWGCDEEHLSLKTIMAGGQIRIAKVLEASHHFRYEGEKIPFRPQPEDEWYNRMLLSNLCCPVELTRRFFEIVKGAPGLEAANRIGQQNWRPISEERDRLHSIYQLSWEQTVKRIAETPC